MSVIKNRYVTTRALQKRSKQLALCTQCGDIHYKGFWYASDSQFAQMIDEQTDLVSYNRCPACKMQEKGLYAGILRIHGVPADILDRVFSVIQRVVDQDRLENPQHRVLAVSVTDDGYILTTTSSRMVRRIGRKMLDAFDTCEAKSTYRKDPKPLQVTNIAFSTPSYFSSNVQS